LNFIFGIVRLFVCVCAFSLRRESPNMILGDKPLIFRWFCHTMATAIYRRCSTRVTSTPGTAALRPQAPPRRRCSVSSGTVGDSTTRARCSTNCPSSSTLARFSLLWSLLLPLASVVPGCLFAKFFWSSVLLVMSITGCCESPEGSYLRM
jgi:hypothetical protein